MILKTLLLSAVLAIGPSRANDFNHLSNRNINAETIKHFLRNRRASEGEVTDFGGNIMIDESAIGGEKQPDGKICIKKVFNVNETEFEHGMDCHHKLKTKCHLTYITDYHSAPEKKCETVFNKDCRITFKPVPHVEKVKKCHVPFEKKCGDDIEGPEKCQTVYETLCKTVFKEYDIDEDHPQCSTVEDIQCNKVPIELLHLPQEEGQRPFAEKERCEKWPVQKCNVERKTVKKVHPSTECKKVARTVCAPSNCIIVPGPEICNDESRTLVQNIPDEECDIQPHEHCKTEATLVPRLVPKENCIKVPKEICVNTKKNPRTIPKAIVKNWCFDPKELKTAVEQ